MNISSKIAFFALSAALLASCGGGGGAEELKLTINFESNGGSAVAPITVKYGDKASKPADPTKANYTFDGWFVDAALKVSFDFDQEITADWTLYAKWNDGGEPALSTEEENTSIEEGTSAQQENTSKESSTWTMTFIDAGWWNEAAAGTTYTLEPAEGAGAFSTTLASYVTGSWDETTRTNKWAVEIPASADKIQFFRASGDGATDWGARTVVIDLTAREGKTHWALGSTAAWYGDRAMATGAWTE